MLNNTDKSNKDKLKKDKSNKNKSNKNKSNKNKSNKNKSNKDKPKKIQKRKIQGTGHGKVSLYTVGQSLYKMATWRPAFLKKPSNYPIVQQSKQDIITNRVINSSNQNTIASPYAVHTGGVKIKRRINNGSGWLLNSRVSNGSPNMNQVSGPSILNRASQFANTTINKGKKELSNFVNRSEIEYRKKVAIANRNRNI